MTPPSDTDRKPSSPKARSRSRGLAAAGRAPRFDWLSKHRDGDEQAFGELVEEYRQPLLRFFARLSWDRGRAEDFVQEVFLKLLRTAASYRPEGHLKTFVYRIATNLWIDHYRAKRPRPRLYSLEQPTLGAAADPELPDAVSPAQRMIDDEEKASLRDALETLTEPHRLVFELAVYQEMAYADVGQVLGIPVGTVKSRMHNAVKALKAKLAVDLSDRSQTDASGHRQGDAQ